MRDYTDGNWHTDRNNLEKENEMIVKKVIIVTLTIVLFILAGCGISDKKDGGMTQTSLVPAAATETKPIGKSTPSGSKSPAEVSKPLESTSPLVSGTVTPQEQTIIDNFTRVEAPDFTLEDKDGNKVVLSELRGTPVVLNFWATWCPYCVEEFGIFSKAQKNFPQIKFLGIDTNEKDDLSDKNNRKADEDFARGKGFELPILFDVNGELFKEKYTMQGLPSTFLIDASGNVRLGFSGAMPDYQTLEILLNAFLKAK